MTLIQIKTIGTGNCDYPTIVSWWAAEAADYSTYTGSILSNPTHLASGDLVTQDVVKIGQLQGNQIHQGNVILDFASHILDNQYPGFLKANGDPYTTYVDSQHYFILRSQPGYEFKGDFNDHNVPVVLGSGNLWASDALKIYLPNPFTSFVLDARVPFLRLENFIIQNDTSIDNTLSYINNKGYVADTTLYNGTAYGVGVYNGAIADSIGINHIIQSGYGTTALPFQGVGGGSYGWEIAGIWTTGNSTVRNCMVQNIGSDWRGIYEIWNGNTLVVTPLINFAYGIAYDSTTNLMNNTVGNIFSINHNPIPTNKEANVFGAIGYFLTDQKNITYYTFTKYVWKDIDDGITCYNPQCNAPTPPCNTSYADPNFYCDSGNYNASCAVNITIAGFTTLIDYYGVPIVPTNPNGYYYLTWNGSEWTSPYVGNFSNGDPMPGDYIGGGSITLKPIADYVNLGAGGVIDGGWEIILTDDYGASIYFNGDPGNQTCTALNFTILSTGIVHSLQPPYSTTGWDSQGGAPALVTSVPPTLGQSVHGGGSVLEKVRYNIASTAKIIANNNVAFQVGAHYDSYSISYPSIGTVPADIPVWAGWVTGQYYPVLGSVPPTSIVQPACYIYGGCYSPSLNVNSPQNADQFTQWSTIQNAGINNASDDITADFINNIIPSACFINPTAGNTFNGNLLSTASQLRGSGVSGPQIFTVIFDPTFPVGIGEDIIVYITNQDFIWDVQGQPRIGLWDIGADQYGSGLDSTRPDSIPLITFAKIPSTGIINLYTDGSSGIYNNINMSIYGTGISNYLTLYNIGASGYTWFGKIPLWIGDHGEDHVYTINSGLPLFIGYGELNPILGLPLSLFAISGIANSNMPLVLPICKDITQIASMPLWIGDHNIYNIYGISGSIPLFIGYGTLPGSSINLYLCGMSGISSFTAPLSIPAVYGPTAITSTTTGTFGMDLYIYGKNGISGNIPLYIPGAYANINNALQLVLNNTGQTTGIPLYVIGGGYNPDPYFIGTPGATGIYTTFPLFINRPSNNQEQFLGLYVSTLQGSNSGIMPLYIQVPNSSTYNNVNLIMWSQYNQQGMSFYESGW